MPKGYWMARVDVGVEHRRSERREGYDGLQPAG
jgi:hypothetical protein